VAGLWESFAEILSETATTDSSAGDSADSNSQE
jgi:hypothetical protein